MYTYLTSDLPVPKFHRVFERETRVLQISLSRTLHVTALDRALSYRVES